MAIEMAIGIEQPHMQCQSNRLQNNKHIARAYFFFSGTSFWEVYMLHHHCVLLGPESGAQHENRLIAAVMIII